MNPTKETKILIVTLGGTPDPILYALENYLPNFVYFIPSENSKNQIDTILNKFKEKNHGEFKHEIFSISNPQDPIESYRVCKNCVESAVSNFSPSSIRADITGGTKIMSFALGMAAASFSIKLSYIGGQERSKDGLGTVQSGYETLIISENPWKEFAEEEKKRFTSLFNLNEYKAAHEIAKSLSENKKLPESDQLFYKQLKLICEGLHNWDLWNFSQAHKCISDDKKRYEKYRAYSSTKYSEFFEKIIHLSEEYLDKDVLKNSIPTKEKLKDLIGSTYRRAEQGKFDDASLRLYRVLEMYAQYHLYSSFHIDPGKISQNDLEDIIKKLENYDITIYKGNALVQNQSSDAYIKFDHKDGYYHTGGQYQNYILLNYLSKAENIKDEDNIGYKMARGEFFQDRRDIESLRNASYLAHGVSAISESSFVKNFLKLISMGVLKSTSLPVKTSNFKELNPEGFQMVKFPKLPD